jgi:predicted nucleic acid-binding protein
VAAEAFLLDTNIFDKIVADPEALQLVRSLTSEGKIALFTTHVQEDELAEIPDEAKKERIVQIPRKSLPTGFIIGYSRLDMARLGTEAPIEAIRRGNREKYTEDALIAATAQADSCLLITEDNTLRKRAESGLGLTVWGWERFREHLLELAAND